MTPVDTMRLITSQVRKLEGYGITEFDVRLTPGDYEDLLKIKHLPYTLRVLGHYGPYFDNRPLKTYAGHRLQLVIGGHSHLYVGPDKKFAINPFVNHAPYLAL